MVGQQPSQPPGSPNPYGPQPGANPYGPPPAGSPYGAQAGSPYGQPNPYAAPGAEASPQWGMGYGQEHVLASRLTRLAGAIVDGLLFVPLVLPAIIAAGLADGDEPGAGFMAAIALAVIGGLALGIYQIYLISTTGQSIAKRWLGMKIIKVTGEDVDFVSGVLLRSWVPGLIGAIPVVGSFFQLADPLFIFGEERRCLHDMIASTKVISV